jgi:hypothetical protein
VDRCLVENPPLMELEPGHTAACWVAAGIEQKVSA